MLHNLLIGLETILEPVNFFSVFLGVTSGVIVGALPGLSATMGCVLILPFTFFMEPIPAIALMSALYCGATYGGSISAILINAPGTSAAAATTIDGYKLTQKGKAGKALGISVISSGIGGLFSVLILISLAPQVANLAINFAAPEYFSLALFGISMVTRLKAGDEIKNLIGALIGIFLSMVGIDVLTGFPRFAFGNVYLLSGVGFIPVMIGLFAGAETFRMSLGRDRIKSSAADVGNLPTLSEIISLKWCILRSAIIGTFIGILPAAGGTAAAFISYNEGKRWSKKPDEYGNGALEGVCAAETANNAATGGAMVPTLTLGIPGGTTTAVILGGLMIQGLRPGPLLFVNQTRFVYAIFVAMAFANILFLIFGLFGAKLFSQVTRIPKHILGPIVTILCFVGSYSVDNNIAGIWIMLIVAVIGYIFKEIGFSPVPIILGMVLGEIIEYNLRQAMAIFDMNIFVLFTRPYSAIFLFLAIFSVFWPFVRNGSKKGLKSKKN